MGAATSRRGNIPMLWLVVALGTGLRVALAFAFYGHAFDVGSYLAVYAALQHDPLHVYSHINSLPILGGALYLYRWPYPPGYFPWIVAMVRLADVTHLPFHGLIKLLPIAADGALAYLVQSQLGRDGASSAVRLAAAALVALGPAFILTSAYQGQLDSIAMLPAVAAVVLWTRSTAASRAPWAGLLVGAGGLLKTVPFLMLLALLPTARSRREAATLVAAAVALPLLGLLPFAVADATGLGRLTHYAGVYGLGGLSLVIQPAQAGFWLTGRLVQPSGAFLALARYGSLFSVAALALTAVALFRARVAPLQAAAAIWLVVYVAGAGFAFQYLVWGLPFFLMRGHLGAVAVVQGLILIPALEFYGYLSPPHATAVFVALMLLLWVGFLVAIARAAWHLRPPPAGPTVPPPASPWAPPSFPAGRG